METDCEIWSCTIEIEEVSRLVVLGLKNLLHKKIFDVKNDWFPY